MCVGVYDCLQFSSYEYLRFHKASDAQYRTIMKILDYVEVDEKPAHRVEEPMLKRKESFGSSRLCGDDDIFDMIINGR